MRHQQNQNKKKQLRNEMKIVASASQFFRNAGFHRFEPGISQGFRWEIGEGFKAAGVFRGCRLAIGDTAGGQPALPTNGNIGLENAS